MMRIFKLSIKFAPWIALLLLSPYFWLPTSYWFDVDYVRVANTVVGVSPALTVSRTIHRPFVASWAATVRKVESEDGVARFVTTCAATGRTNYIPEASFPKGLNLDWWTFPVHCLLDKGQYIMTTVWTINLLGGIERDVVVPSNVFMVKGQEPE